MKKTPTSAEGSTLDETSPGVITNPVTERAPHLESREGCGVRPVSPEFSLVSGGPLFQLYRRAHLSGEGLELLHRRVLATALVAWLPLLLLSIFQGHALGGALQIPFLHDIEVNARFLVALPVLIIAEVVVHNRISPLVRRFVQGHIVAAEDLPAFEAAVNSAKRVRNSIAVELVLLGLVYTVGLGIWRSQVALAEPTWYATPEAKQLHLTWAGYWYVFASLPIFQFILMRWYLRLVIWFRFLWQISRLNLHLSAAHPDRAGGIGFLGKGSYAFGPILLAEGTLLAGLIASRVLYEGRELLSFKMEAAGFVGFFVLVVLGPLVMFTPRLERTRRQASAEYGLMANRYLFQLEQKGLSGGYAETSEPPNTQDIKSLVDVRNMYLAVSQMRLVPFGSEDITRLALTTAAPLLPLTLTIFSVGEVAKFLVKTVFR